MCNADNGNTPAVMLDILRAISAAMADGYEVFGIRNDAVKLAPGTECHPSHQLYQDAEYLEPWEDGYDDNPDAENLRYPWNDELQAYDAGELPRDLCRWHPGPGTPGMPPGGCRVCISVPRRLLARYRISPRRDRRKRSGRVDPR